MRNKLPKEITTKNMFLCPEEFQDRTYDTKTGLLDNFSQIMFFPTEEQCHDQCFNFGDFLSAMILPRLIYYRDKNPGQILDARTDSSEPEDPTVEKDIMNKIIMGFWIEINIEPCEITEEEQNMIKEARILLAKHWDELWF